MQKNILVELKNKQTRQTIQMQIYGEIFKITGRQFRKIITDSDQFQPVV